MANTKIRGITIELGADTTGLNKALKDVNAETKTTKKELSDIEKLLKLDPKNVELLEQKQKLLNKQVDSYSSKLKSLKDAQNEFAEAAAQGDEKAQRAYDALQREIVSTEDYLEKARKSAEAFNVETAKISANLTDFGNKATEVADKTKAISLAGAAVAGSLGAMAVKAMTASDDLNTLAQQTGFSTDELQKFAYASDRVDVSTDTIVGALKKIKTNMGSGSAVFNQLGVSVKNADGSLRDATAVFYDSLEALSHVKNETERDTIAMQLFGKSADDLATIIDDGGAKLKALGDEAERNGKIWTKESIDAANAVNDLVDGLKADVTQTILITGAKALEALAPVIETVINAISGLLDFISRLSPEMIALIGTVAVVIASISPIAGLIGSIALAINQVMMLLPALTPLIAGVTAIAPWLALGVAVATLAGLIVSNWDAIKVEAGKFKDAIFNGLIQPILDYIEGVNARWDAFWDALKERAKTNINAIIDFVNGAIDAINSLTSAINSSAIGQALGINIGQIGNIPQMANGGSISSGSALVGERGAELLSMNNGVATVTPLTHSTTINNITQASDRPIQLTVQLDRAVLAQQLYTANEWEGVRRGGAAFSR